MLVFLDLWCTFPPVCGAFACTAGHDSFLGKLTYRVVYACEGGAKLTTVAVQLLANLAETGLQGQDDVWLAGFPQLFLQFVTTWRGEYLPRCQQGLPVLTHPAALYCAADERCIAAGCC